MKLSLLPTTPKGWASLKIRVAVFVVLIISFLLYVKAMPGSSFTGEPTALTQSETESVKELKRHISYLADTIGSRSIHTPAALKKTEEYIIKEFATTGYPVLRHSYNSGGRELANLEIIIPGTEFLDTAVVVGAHYDTYPGTPGANDNGSGVASLIILAKKLTHNPPKRTTRLVAFVNEEPPFFGGTTMGSMLYARNLWVEKVPLKGMISLETMGYFSDEKGSQDYPFIFQMLYPSTGNFIVFVGNMRSKGFMGKALGLFRDKVQVPSYGAAAPGFIHGIGWSDHFSFWKYGYRGFMITDTAPFRYKHYHEATDTPEKIDYEKLARIVEVLPTMVQGL